MIKYLLKDNKGTAMTEGVIVIPFFLIIWMGLVALHNMYAERLNVQTQSYNTALAMARSGECGQSDLSIDDISQTSSMDTGLEMKESQMIEDIAGCQPFAWSHANTKVSSQVEDVPDLFGGDNSTVTGKSIFMCNMKPVDGLMELVASIVKTSLGLSDD